MRYTDLHTHTVFSDGKNTPEEMVLAALEKNMDCLGFSDHGYTRMDAGWCVMPESISEYQRTIAALKEKYGDRIKILCGIEMDAYGNFSTQGFDYVIGSVHYLDMGDDYISMDLSPEELVRGAKQYFDGDIYALVEAYYAKVGELAQRKEIDIIGHFDLVTKFQEKCPLFDTEHPRYKKAWMDAADKLLTLGVPFEINTGAISRGYRTTPYPAIPIAEYIRSRGGKLIINSDTHSAMNLCCEFDKWKPVYESI